ncbi:hypothetical protein [Oxynema aestuarii]|uniref:Uncharacterized protein n=1 Tax=Oxynema aestuarii AP17 TaxID=2064643 RepID=A0A6H1TRR8_9CYAN|nr:hypothetical protein [Oxynema aestuarii]QIZ69292.1 hypothetical protein HCG48_00720 [Oxynema aestuarii AP17]
MNSIGQIWRSRSRAKAIAIAPPIRLPTFDPEPLGIPSASDFKGFTRAIDGSICDRNHR